MMAAEPLQRITATDFFFIKTFRSSGVTLQISSVVSYNYLFYQLSFCQLSFYHLSLLLSISFFICLFCYLSLLLSLRSLSNQVRSPLYEGSHRYAASGQFIRFQGSRPYVESGQQVGIV